MSNLPDSFYYYKLENGFYQWYYIEHADYRRYADGSWEFIIPRIEQRVRVGQSVTKNDLYWDNDYNAFLYFDQEYVFRGNEGTENDDLDNFEAANRFAASNVDSDSVHDMKAKITRYETYIGVLEKDKRERYYEIKSLKKDKKEINRLLSREKSSRQSECKKTLDTAKGNCASLLYACRLLRQSINEESTEEVLERLGGLEDLIATACKNHYMVYGLKYPQPTPEPTKKSKKGDQEKGPKKNNKKH